MWHSYPYSKIEDSKEFRKLDEGNNQNYTA